MQWKWYPPAFKSLHNWRLQCKNARIFFPNHLNVILPFVKWLTAGSSVKLQSLQPQVCTQGFQYLHLQPPWYLAGVLLVLVLKRLVCASPAAKAKAPSSAPLTEQPVLTSPWHPQVQESPRREIKAPNYLQCDLAAQVLLTNHSCNSEERYFWRL